MHQIIEPEILSPQIRELYEALMIQGHIEEALKLAKEANLNVLDNDPDVDESFDYLISKEKTVQNMLIHIMAEALEKNTCTKGVYPCNLCIGWAQQIMPPVWKPIREFIRSLENRGGWLTQYQMMDKLQKFMESDPVVVMESEPTQGPKITKAPKIR